MASCSADETHVPQADTSRTHCQDDQEREYRSDILNIQGSVGWASFIRVLGDIEHTTRSINQQWSHQMPTMLLYYIFTKDIRVQHRTEVAPGALEISTLGSLTYIASYHHLTIPRIRAEDDVDSEKINTFRRTPRYCRIHDHCSVSIESRQIKVKGRVPSMSTLEGFQSPSDIALSRSLLAMNKVISMHRIEQIV